MASPPAPAPASEGRPPAVRRMGCELSFEVTEAATVVLQVAPATSAGERLEERLEVTADGRALPPPREMVDGCGNRAHVLTCPRGRLTVAYQAAVRPPPAPDGPTPGPGEALVDELGPEQLIYLRQSRYCPSDQMAGLACTELGHFRPGLDLAGAVVDWVAARLSYEGGASGPLDTAVDTLLTGRGVCRDYAHLTVAMCRALGVPARVVGAYAPGLSPMDFHAVAEAWGNGAWYVFDASRLAPRTSLVRVATGRDAADTAFVTVVSGGADLLSSRVQAVIDGDLPRDDHTGLVRLA